MDSISLLAHSAARNLLLGLNPDESLVFGHTHLPYAEELESGIWVGNTGAWGPDLKDPVTGEHTSNSYLKIYDGKIELNFFNSSKMTEI